MKIKNEHIKEIWTEAAGPGEVITFIKFKNNTVLTINNDLIVYRSNADDLYVDGQPEIGHIQIPYETLEERK